MGKSIRLDGNDSVQTIQKINEALAAQGLAFVLDEGRIHEGIAYTLEPVHAQASYFCSCTLGPGEDVMGIVLCGTHQEWLAKTHPKERSTTPP